MLVAEKYHLQREIGWSDEAEVHLGPASGEHHEPIAVKIRHGMGGPPRPDGNRERFLKACAGQQEMVAAGCKQVAPIWETGYEGDNAYYVTRQYPRSLGSLIQGHVALEASALHRITGGVLHALEELRDRGSRSHGNIKPTNVFLEGKTAASAGVVLSDLARPADPGTQGGDCYALGTVLFQLVREHTVRHFDWPIQPGPDWDRLGRQGDAWREYCNLLLSPDLQANPAALAAARAAFKDMRHLHVTPGEGAADKDHHPKQGHKGVLAGSLVAAALAAGAGAVFLLPTKRAPVDPAVTPAPTVAAVDPATTHPTATATPVVVVPETTPAVAQASPALPDGTPDDSPAVAPMPALVEATTPTPVLATPAGDRWIGYTALLQQFQREIDDPKTAEQPETVNANLSRLRDSIGFLPVKDDPTVETFLKHLPPRLEATGDQPDLPPELWTKEGVTRTDGLESVTCQWGHSGFRFVFNRVSVPSGPAFYLSATTVPVQFGAVLAKMAESDGKGPLSGASSVKGPVAWESVRGNYAPRGSWMLLDNINAPFYANAGRPAADSPMNGLSAIEATRLARAAGASLPTLAQWAAVLASPSGQQWAAQWQLIAKVRSPQWAAFAKGIQAQHLTGAKLPNDQCFGDKNDLSAVTQTAGQSLFFESVRARNVRGFAHLVGNVGQYLVDDARNPTKYYFAGGSAEAAPSAFQSLAAPPAVLSPFLAAADGGLRLTIAAKGTGSEKNPAFDQLKGDVKAELARVEKIQ